MRMSGFIGGESADRIGALRPRIEWIPAQIQQAMARIERPYATLQDQPVKELRLAMTLPYRWIIRGTNTMRPVPAKEVACLPRVCSES